MAKRWDVVLHIKGKPWNTRQTLAKKIIDSGVYYLSFDEELAYGDEICFCSECIELFGKFLKEKYPGIEYINPHVFEKEPAKNSKLHSAWQDFKCYQISEYTRIYRENIETYAASKGVKEKIIFSYTACPGQGWEDDYKKSVPYRINLEDPRLIGKYIDWYVPMLQMPFAGKYTMAHPDKVTAKTEYNMEMIAQEMSALVKIIGDGRAKPMADLIGGYAMTTTPDGMLKAEILEALLSGGKGFDIYAHPAIDAMDLKNIAEALRMVTPYEDIIMVGRPVEVRDKKGIVFAKGIESTKGALILVSDYSDYVKAGEIEYKAKKKSKVIDLAADKVIAEISPFNPIFDVILDKDRARLFYITNE